MRIGIIVEFSGLRADHGVLGRNGIWNSERQYARAGNDGRWVAHS
jgi:hypothetical protein